MHTTIPLLDLPALEKLREEELEEARAIQRVMLPSESLRAGAVTISHEFQPVAAAGGDFLDYLSADGCRLLELAGMPPGLFPAASYESTAIQLKPGDSVLFCTDGLTDATSRNGEQFGIERLHQLCGEARFDGRAELLQKLFATVESFSAGCEQKDDMAATLFHLAE